MCDRVTVNSPHSTLTLALNTLNFFCPHSHYPFTLSTSISSGLTKVFTLPCTTALRLCILILIKSFLISNKLGKLYSNSAFLIFFFFKLSKSNFKIYWGIYFVGNFPESRLRVRQSVWPFCSSCDTASKTTNDIIIITIIGVQPRPWVRDRVFQEGEYICKFPFCYFPSLIPSKSGPNPYIFCTNSINY